MFVCLRILIFYVYLNTYLVFAMEYKFIRANNVTFKPETRDIYEKQSSLEVKLDAENQNLDNLSVKIDDSEFQSHTEFLEITNLVLKYYSILVILFGTIFNSINFGCFYRMKKHNSQNVYLSALSLADLFNIQINILVPLVRSSFKQSFIEDFDSLSSDSKQSFGWGSFLCILDGYLVEIGLLLPVWLMVVLAAERFIIIVWPLRKNSICTPHHAKLVLTALITTILIFSLYKLKTVSYFTMN